MTQLMTGVRVFEVAQFAFVPAAGRHEGFSDPSNFAAPRTKTAHAESRRRQTISLQNCRNLGSEYETANGLYW